MDAGTKLTTNSPVAWIFLSVSLPHGGRSVIPMATIGGALVITLKKEKGAAFRDPSAPRVSIHAIGRGTTQYDMILYRSLVSSFEKSKSMLNTKLCFLSALHQAASLLSTQWCVICESHGFLVFRKNAELVALMTFVIFITINLTRTCKIIKCSEKIAQKLICVLKWYFKTLSTSNGGKPLDAGTLKANISDHAGSDGVPLYLRVALSLRTRIYQGEWQKGDKLPAFENLSQHYGVAMNTIRKAIQVLSSQSLIDSARGMGTWVTGNAPALSHQHLRASIADPLDLSPNISICILENGEVSQLNSELIQDYPMAKNYHRIFKTHVLEKTPFALLDIYVDSDLYKSFPIGAERHTKLSRLLRDCGGVEVVQSREELTISHADQHVAQLLSIPIASPIVRLRRWRMASNGNVVYACVAIYRSDLFVWDVTRPESTADHFGLHIIPTSKINER